MIYNRSADYRRKFLRYYKGVFGSGNYHCSYCGKLLSPKKLRVDHLIPVYRVKKFGIGRFLMKMKGIDDINDVKNLVPSCERCNSQKSSKMGLWLIRGEIGRHFFVWLFFKSFVLALAILVLYQNREAVLNMAESVFSKYH